MPMDPKTFRQFKALLLGLPGWNSGSSRKAFLHNVYWGQALLTRLRYDIAGEEAATELLELLDKMDAPTVDGLSPACALLKAVAEEFGSGGSRASILAELEAALCQGSAAIRSVLFFAATPDNLARIRVDREYREIQQCLRLAERGDQIHLHPPVLAARPGDLTRALNNLQPDLVHFSGHGGGEEGLYLEDESGAAQPVSDEALERLFRVFASRVRVVLLNACLTRPQAEVIARHIDYVVGTGQEIGDDTAIAFATGFYQALGVQQSIEKAFSLGCAQIRLQGIPEHQVPVLLSRQGGHITCD